MNEYIRIREISNSLQRIKNFKGINKAQSNSFIYCFNIHIFCYIKNLIKKIKSMD